MVISHVIPEIDEYKKIDFQNYIVYFWNCMVDDHVIPTLHKYKLSVKGISRITWMPAMEFRNYILHINAFLELHGVFPESHG